MIEIMIALAVMSIAILALLGVFPLMTDLQRGTIEQSEALYDAQETMDELLRQNAFVGETPSTTMFEGQAPPNGATPTPTPVQKGFGIVTAGNAQTGIQTVGLNGLVSISPPPGLPNGTRTYWGDPPVNGTEQTIHVLVQWVDRFGLHPVQLDCSVTPQ